MPRKRQAAWLVLGAGLIVAGVGAAGLAMTRQPVTTQYGATPTLPARPGRSPRRRSSDRPR